MVQKPNIYCNSTNIREDSFTHFFHGIGATITASGVVYNKPKKGVKSVWRQSRRFVEQERDSGARIESRLCIGKFIAKEVVVQPAKWLSLLFPGD